MKTTTPNLFADGFLFLEAPTWREDQLWVSDVFDHKVYTLGDRGQKKAIFNIANRPSGLGFLSDGTLIVASAKDSKLLSISNGTLSEYADLSGCTTGWLNDFAIDRNDRIYAGNFGYDFVGGEKPKYSSLHRVDPDRTITVAADGVEFPNGAVVIDGGRTLVVAETWNARLIAFDIGSGGDLDNRRVFADLKGRQPDGICADADGGIWAGIYNTGEFIRVLAGGEVTHSIEYKGSGISCTLGGPENRTLFMTTYLGTGEDMSLGKRNSAIFTIPVDVPGIA